MNRTLFSFLSISVISLVTMKASPGGCSHVEQHDGPYVSYRDGKIFVSTILNDHGKYTVRTDSFPEASRSAVKLNVATDVPGEFLSFPLKKSIETEKSEQKKVAKQFVISDIESNFSAFKKLLIAGNVIDAKYNWTFGEGHLVLTGDFVDRGENQTEVLWLIYSLEEKAKEAGGYVHYVLGNHEIMNLSGDLRYLNPKYNEVNALLGENYMSLLGPDTELGRWLRSKNIIERVGEMLYVHGGISADVNQLDLSARQINELSRPWYSDTTLNYPDPRTGVIYFDNGPFWYRGYYGGSLRASQAQVDSTLERHHVDHIITGHTIVSEKISTWFEGKVINTDVHHAKGISEGLLIQGKEFFRVTADGVRTPLPLKQ
jgi:hypothetical protein